MLTTGDEEGGTERKLIDRKHKQNGFVTSKLLRLIFFPNSSFFPELCDSSKQMDRKYTFHSPSGME